MAESESKQRNVPEGKGEFGYGDVWTWVATDADTKLVPTFQIGSRDLQDAVAFVGYLSRRLANRVRLTTDGLRVYSPAECLGTIPQAIRGNPDPDHISMGHNFCPVHKTLGTTPAVAAGITDHVWKPDELIGLLEAAEAAPVKRGPYKRGIPRSGSAGPLLEEPGEQVPGPPADGAGSRHDVVNQTASFSSQSATTRPGVNRILTNLVFFPLNAGIALLR